MGKTGNNQEELLKSALAAIEKEYGKGSIMTLGARERVSIDVISSGSLALDRALGIGGYPKGRVIEIFGPESSGKTTTALHAVAECQKSGGMCAYIDVEHAIDPVYAEALGVNVDTLLLSQPDRGEQLKDGTEFIGNATKLKIVKNKVAPPFKTAVVNIVYGQGFSHADEIITMGVEYGIVEKSGSWYSYNGEKIGQGMNAARKFMEANPDIDEEITERIKAAMFTAED